MLETIFERRSIRKYTAEPVSSDEIQTLLRAAQAAPSANDTRPWSFVAVCDPARRRALAQTHEWSAMAAEAPLVMVVLGDPAISSHWVEDCSAATENLLLAATGLGLGGVWVAVYLEPACETRVRAALQVPQHLRVLCLVPIGHPGFSPRPRGRFETDKVHYESYAAHERTEI